MDFSRIKYILLIVDCSWYSIFCEPWIVFNIKWFFNIKYKNVSNWTTLSHKCKKWWMFIGMFLFTMNFASWILEDISIKIGIPKYRRKFRNSEALQFASYFEYDLGVILDLFWLVGLIFSNISSTWLNLTLTEIVSFFKDLENHNFLNNFIDHKQISYSE